jgi:predicted transcriptional regulator
MARRLLETRSDEYLSLVARELLLSEGQNLEETITLISKKLNVSKEKIERFVKYLYRRNFLLKSRERFGFTIEGVNFLLNLAEVVYFDKNLEGGIHEHGRS